MQSWPKYCTEATDLLINDMKFMITLIQVRARLKIIAHHAQIGYKTSPCVSWNLLFINLSLFKVKLYK